MEPKFYLVQNRPFEKKDRNSPESWKLQENCVSEDGCGICGMGWPGNISLFNTDKTLLLADYKDEYLKQHGKSNGLSKVLNIYSDMDIGDYVLTRLYNSRCYVGRIESKAYHNKSKQLQLDDNGENFSWIVNVKWKYVGEELTLPGAVRGLMARRLTTADRFPADDKVGRFVVQELFNKTGTRFKLSENSFAASMSPEDLEDLVCFYIQACELKNGENYHIIPSTCKPSTKKYEFSLLSDNQKVIVCQVKNLHEVPINEYESKEFHKVYLFSGKGEYGKNEPNENNTVIIDHKSLFTFLKYEYNKGGYIKSMLGDYYTL